MTDIAVRSTLDTRLRLYALQVEIRQFEEKLSRLFNEGLLTTSHLAIGQEAIAAGFGVAMRSDDWTFCTYRGHHHTLARGVPMGPTMAECMGRGNGLMSGKGGSMHLTSVEHHAMGSYAIVGAHLPVAAGAAWSALARGTDQVAVCFFGDGTTNIGAFHEALNIAALWKLPVVYVCENNGYGEYTPVSGSTSVPHPAADRASAYGLERVLIDGNDADVVYRTAVDALAKARAGGGPTLIEAETYRHSGHSRSDLGKYRPQQEIDAWMLRDPLPNYRARLLAEGVDEAVLAQIESDAAALVAAAEAEARGGDYPSSDKIMTDVWSDGGSSWRN